MTIHPWTPSDAGSKGGNELYDYESPTVHNSCFMPLPIYQLIPEERDMICFNLPNSVMRCHFDIFPVSSIGVYTRFGV